MRLGMHSWVYLVQINKNHYAFLSSSQTKNKEQNLMEINRVRTWDVEVHTISELYRLK